MNTLRTSLILVSGSFLAAVTFLGCGGDTGSVQPGAGGTNGTGGSTSVTTPAGGATSSTGTSTSSGGAATASGGTTAASTVIEQGTVTATVTVTPATTYQTLEGFGAAVAWYQTTLTGHTSKAELYQLLFAELGLDILRFRNTYSRGGTGTVDVTAEKEILDQATASLGRRPKVLLTSWSPPSSLKESGVEDCSGADTCTLKRTNTGAFVYDDFATYWLNSLNAYNAAGVAPDFVSIQNEPDFIPTGWEGCKFAPTETTTFPGYDEALSRVSTRLSTLASPPKLLGPETLGVHYGKVTTYMTELDSSLLYGVAHHLYEMGNDGVWDWRDPGPDSYTDDMMNAESAASGLPIFMTEFQTDDDHDTDGGFETAWLIHNSLAEQGASAWLYWDLIWGGAGGLVTLNGSSYTVRDQYYSLRHYARYTDPGYVRVGSSSTIADVRVSAFRSADSTKLTLVVLNVGSTEQTLGFDLGTFAATTSEVYRTVYNPGSSEVWSARPRVDTGGTLTLPGRSVATIALSL